MKNLYLGLIALFFTLSLDAQTTIEVQVSSADDDMEERIETGILDPGSSDLELGSEDGDLGREQIVGIRFAEVNIPKGALVVNAAIQFAVDENKNTDDANYDISAQADPNPPTFDPNTNGDISSRTTFEMTVPWMVTGGTWTVEGEAGPNQRTPDLSALVQMAIEQDDWQTGGPLVFIITGVGNKVAESYDGEPALAPKLIVTYVETTEAVSQISSSTDDVEEYLDDPGQTNTVGSMDITSSDLELGSEQGDGGDKQLVGLRFTGVDVPAGALITHASIQFTVDENKNTDVGNYRIMAVNDPDPATFADELFNVSSRETFDANVPWTVTGGTWTNAGDAGDDQRTPDISELIQHVVSQEGWASGNALVITIEGDGNKVAESFDGDAAAAPVLTVRYAMTESKSYSIASSEDDIEEYIDGPMQTQEIGSYDVTSSDLELGSEDGDGTDPQLVGMRFTNVDVEQGATVTHAYIQFTVDESKNTDDGVYTIRVQNSADAEAFNTAELGNVSGRETLEMTMPWTVTGGTWTNAGDAGPDQQTPNIAPLIQEIVNLPDWASGNSIVVTVEGTGTKVAESYDGDAAAAPRLMITTIAKEDGDGTTALYTCTDDLPEGSNREVVLEVLSTYATGVFDEGAAEIVAYDPNSRRIFFTNADANSVGILDINDPSNPTLVDEIDMSAFGGGVNSVDVRNGVIAVAVEAEESTDNGSIVLMDMNGTVLNQLEAGALPDMVTFSPDGNLIVAANEGEPSDDYLTDPEGSITIVDISGGAANATATTISFDVFNGREASLRNKGVRIFGPGATAAQDLEPEYVTMPNDSLIYVNCQENNALVVVNARSQMVMDIFPLGVKDYNSGRPRLTEFILNEVVEGWPELGTPVYDGGQDPVFLGGFSGMWYDENESTDEVLTFYMIPDRGPNDGAVNRNNVTPVAPGNLRPFKLPDYQGRIAKITLNTATGEVKLDDQIFLTQQDGTTPITGRGNIPGFDETPVTYADANTAYPNVDYTENGSGEEFHALPFDPYGGDFEGILRDANGYFWMCDEYRPAIYHFDMNGTLIERYVPEGTSMLGTTPQPEGTYGAETLPAVYSKRRANRGFEAIAYDWDEDIVYAFIQSPIENPDNGVRNNSDVIRILGINPEDGTPVREYVYLLERNKDSGFSLGRVDKIGDAVYVGNGTFWILERDSSVPGENCGKKYVYSISLVGATDILGTAISRQDTGMTLELMSADDLAAADIQAVHKTKVLNLPSIGYLPSDKPEGIARLSDGSIAVMNDNDFGLAGAGVSDNSSLGIIQFCDDNAIDASNEAEDIEIRNWPVLSFFMPDAMKSYEVDGKAYIVTANEGDARDYDGYSEEDRVGDLTLDPDAYPDATDLQPDEQLGRLNITLANGDYDNDGDYDQIYGYGARSFSIWDQYGNLVYDSGNEFARLIAQMDPDNFNSNNDENGSRKSRSDDKGTEPEAIEIVQRGDSVYALVGLERQGGIFVYNVTDPTWPYYVTYLNNRNFDVDATLPEAGDLGVEDIIFISEEDSPTGEPLIVTANEVSGTVTLFGVEFDKRGFLVRLMHNNDGESKLVPQDIGGRMIGGAAPFITVVDSLRNEGTPNLMLSSGDNYLAGIAFNASLSLPDGRTYYDAEVIDSLAYDALCLGNHDFDFGPDVLERFISDVKNTQPPFLSSNLDFSQEAGLQALVDNGRIAASTVVEKDGEEFGVVGLTTPALRTISSPRNVQIDENITEAVQAEVDLLTGMGINKIILISHLQSINEELELAGMLTGIDVIIAGGGDELLTNNPDNEIPGLAKFGDYPLKAADANGDTVFVVTTPGEYRYLGNLLIEFDDDGTVFEINEESDLILVEGFEADPDIQMNVIDSIIAYQEGLEDNIIAVTEVDLDGTRESIRTIETNQGNLIADAFLWLGNNERDANGLDPNIPLVALQNGGGIRNNNIIPAGSEISEKTTFDMLPFDNAMTFVGPLTAEEFVSALENSVAAIENVDGRFAQIAGYEIVYDMEGVSNEGRIFRATLADGTPIVEDYEIVAGAPSVYIITNSFTAAGGDDYDEFIDAGKVNLGGAYQRTLFDFIVEELNGVIAAADYPEGGEGRIREKSTVGTNFLDLEEANFKVSPNPFRSGLTVQYSMNTSQNVRFSLSDMMGREVYVKDSGMQLPGDYTHRLNVPDLPQGMYTLIIQMDGKVGAQQVVKH